MLQITPWERLALELLASGTPVSHVARQLEVTESEAERRLAALVAKMGAAGYPDAVATAARRGLLRH
jgi:DNA-binding NarL/FixJ family response regulator